MADLRTRYQIDLEGNLERQARRFGRSIDRMSQNSERSLGRMRRGFSAVGNVAERSLNRYSGLVTGAAGFAVGRFMIGFERRLTRLQNANDLTEKSVENLRSSIYETAQDDNIAIPAEQLLAAVEAIVEKTGDLEYARNNLRGIALAIQGAGAEGQAIGEVVAELQKLGVKDPQTTLAILDTLTTQGKEGAFTLNNLASLGPRVITAYSSMVNGGREAQTQMRELGATLQVIRQGTGSAEQAATSFEAVLRTLSDPKKLKMLRQGGIQVFDPEGLKQGEERLRPINELLLEIMAATQGKRTLLGQVFDAEAIRAFNAMKPENMERFYNATGTGETLLKDSTRAANDLAGALDRLNNAWKDTASGSLADTVNTVANAINSIDRDTLDKLIKWGVVGAAGFGAMGVLAKGIKWGGTIAGASKKAIGKGGAAGAISGMTGVTPVYVVNMPGGKNRMPGTGGGPNKGPRRPLKSRGPGRFGKVPLIGLGAGLAYGGAQFADSAINSTETGRSISRTADQWAYSGLKKTLGLFGQEDHAASVFDLLTIGSNGKALERMDRAAEKMERAAERMEKSETTLRLGFDESGRVRLRGLESRGREANVYAGPLRAGSD